jgi:hypothetical protein
VGHASDKSAQHPSKTSAQTLMQHFLSRSPGVQFSFIRGQAFLPCHFVRTANRCKQSGNEGANATNKPPGIPPDRL